MDNSSQARQDIENVFNNTPKGKINCFKALLGMYKGNWCNIVLSLIFFTIKHSPAVVIPYISAEIINIATEPSKHNLNELWVYGIILGILLLINIPFQVLHISFLSKAVRSVEAGLRCAIVRKLQALSITYHKELKSGKLQSKVLRDVEAVEFLSRQLVLTLAPVVVNGTVAITVSSTRSPIVTLFFIITLPICFLLIRFFRTRIRTTNANFRSEIEEMSANVSEMVEMIPVTRAHGLEDVEINRIDRQLEKVRSSGYKLDITTAAFGASYWVTFQAFQVICLMFTSILAYKKIIPIGDVVMYQSYFTMLLNQVSNIIGVYPNIAKGFESIKSISEILTAQDVEDNHGKKAPRNITGQFTFENVYYKYSASDKDVLTNFSLNVKPGECIAFVGESGAGKTTLLNLIIGFLKPTSGKILLDGQDMNELNLQAYRQNIAVVPQNTILFSGTIRNNITYGLPDVSDEKLQQVIQMANLSDLIYRLPNGLDTVIGEHGGKLSGGQRQRISIARALIRDPKIIVLDEATSALDSISEQQIQTAMESLIKDRTTFIVAHRLSTIRNADRIVVVKEGSCSEFGTYEQLMDKKGEFYKLKSLQA